MDGVFLLCGGSSKSFCNSKVDAINVNSIIVCNECWKGLKLNEILKFIDGGVKAIIKATQIASFYNG